MTTLALGLHVTLPSDIDTFSTWFHENYEGALEEHAGRSTLRAYLDGDNGLLSASKRFIGRLREASVTIDGVDLDLVNTSDIADRTGVTRQYVAQLIAGTAGPGDFPQPIGTAGRSRIWDWGTVNEWMRQMGKAEAEAYLSFRETCQLEAWLTSETVRLEVNGQLVYLAGSFASSHEIGSLGADIVSIVPDSLIPMVIKHTHASTRNILGTMGRPTSSKANAMSLGDQAEAWLQTNGK